MGKKTKTELKIGLTAALCLVVSVAYGQWEYTYAGGVIGAWLCCFADKRLHQLWWVTIGSAVAVVSQTSAAAHAVAACLLLAPFVSASAAAFQTVRTRS